MECQYHLCEEEATIYVKAANLSVCEDHYILNVIRFGVDLRGETIDNG